MPRLHRNAGIAAAALAAALASPAHAFDTIQWDWQLDVVTDVTQNVAINASSFSQGAAIVENDQIFVGSGDADSTISNPVNTLPGTGPYTVDDLPKVESTATAVGNNGSIESDLTLSLDSNQTVGVQTETVPATFDPITGTQLTPELTTSTIVPATFTANSTVSGAINTQVESSAQALANNLSVTMDGPTNSDRTLVANNVQTAYADVMADSTVAGASVTDFEGLGTMDEPFVDSSATAVGNNLQIEISGPSTPFIPI